MGLSLALALLIGPGIAWGVYDQVPIQTILLEAAGEPFEGQIAVGNVIRNRAKDGNFEAVCLKPFQFSAWNSRAYASKRLAKATPGEWANARLAWELSASRSVVGSSRHYYASYMKNPPKWAKTASKEYRVQGHVFLEGVK